MQGDVIQVRVEQLFAHFPALAAKYGHGPADDLNSDEPLHSEGEGDILAGMSTVPIKDYVDVKIDAIGARLDGISREIGNIKTEVHASRQEARQEGRNTRWAVWGAALTAAGVVLAALAFAGDRFEGGLGLSAVRIEQAERDRERDETIKLILQRLPPAPGAPTSTP